VSIPISLATSLKDRLALSLNALIFSPIVVMFFFPNVILGRVLSKFSNYNFYGRILSTKVINSMWVVDGWIYAGAYYVKPIRITSAGVGEIVC
jgi:hypothetical protein